MSVPIIEGMTELDSFTTFIELNSETQQIEYLSELPSKGVSTTTGGVADGVIEYHGPLNFRIPDFQPNLTGGSKVGAEAVAVTEVTNGYEVTTGVGTVTSVSLIEILGGIFAGLGLGVLSYEANKDFWIDVSNNLFLNLPGYEPITYDNIEEMSLLTLFKDGKTYIDADLVQAVNNMLIEMGAFNTEITKEYFIPPYNSTNLYRFTGGLEINSVDDIRNLFRGLYEDYKMYLPEYTLLAINKACEGIATLDLSTINIAAIKFEYNPNYGHKAVRAMCSLFTTAYPFNAYSYNWHEEYMYLTTMGGLYNGVSGYAYMDQLPEYQIDGVNLGTQFCIGNDYTVTGSGTGETRNISTSTVNTSVVVTPAIEELPLLPGAIISTTPNSLPSEQNLWWIHKVTLPQADPATGTVTEKQLVPLTVPSTSPKTSPITDPATQAQVQTGTTPQTNTDPIAKSPTNPFTAPNSVFTPPNTPTPTPTPTPAIPVIPAIGGQANKLFTVYNPSQANLDALGATLWTQNIITQIVQMFTNNPMDAIISLHILYATPTTGANKEIKLGYVPTGVSCPEVTNQYVNVNCGTVRVPELFGDARDYANTDISIYLPMIGFRQLKTEDAMGSVIGVDYRVDVFTGTVLATVTITKAGVNQVFYTYEGNCAVNLPLTGADKSRQVATAVGAIGAMVTGSPLMALGSATAIAGGSARAQIQRSGNFTGNAGAMGCKKPYIIVSSDVPYDAVGYNAQYGYPANLTVMLGTCHGYVKVKEVHADTISNATEQEKRDIENQLKQGIIIH